MSRGPYKTRPEPGTFADLIMKFRNSAVYRGWKPSTAAVRERALSAFLRENGRLPVASLRRGDIVAMMDDMADTPHAANTWLKAIRLLLAYAVKTEMIASSPAKDVDRLVGRNPDGHRTWREDEIDAYLAHHKLGTLAHLVFTLALYTGASRADLVRLGPGNIRGDRIVYRREKQKGKLAPEVDLPILPPLAEALAILPPRPTFLHTIRNAPRSAKSLTGDIAGWVDAAGLGAPDEMGLRLTLHGLRKALARRLADASATPQEIMSVMGHTTIAMAMHYSSAYDRRKSAESGFGKLGDAPRPNVVQIRRKE